MAEYDFGDYDFQAAFGSGTALQSDDATQDTPAANNNNKRGRSKENGLPAFVAPPLDKDSLSESGDSSRNTRRRGNSQIHPVPAKLKDDGKPASENIVLPNIDAAHKRQGSASPSAVAKNNNYLNNVTIDDSSPSKNNGWVKETAKRFETPPSSNNNSVNKRPAEDAMIPKGTVASRAAVFNNLSWNDDYDMQTALHSSGSNLSSNLLPMKSTVPMTELHEKMNKRNPMKFTPPLSKNNPPPKPRSDAETVASEVAPLLHARKTTGTSPSVSNATTSNNNKVVGKPPSAPPRQALASPQVTTNKTTTNSSNGVTPRKSSETTSNDSKPTARAAARSLPIGNNKKEVTNTVSQDSGSTHQATPTTSQDGSSKIIANTHNDSPAKYDNKQPCTNHRYTQAQREKLLQWMDYGALRYPIAAPGENVTTTTAASHPNIYRKTETTTAEQRYSYPMRGIGSGELAGETVEVHFDVSNIVQQLVARNRPTHNEYYKSLPLDGKPLFDPAVAKKRRPKTPRSFYGPRKPHKGDLWFRAALDDCREIVSPNIEKMDEEDIEEARRTGVPIKGMKIPPKPQEEKKKEKSEPDTASIDVMNQKARPMAQAAAEL